MTHNIKLVKFIILGKLNKIETKEVMFEVAYPFIFNTYPFKHFTQ